MNSSFFAGVRHHIAIKCAQPRKLLLVVARHFVDEAAFAMHHLVVGQGQNIIFRKSIGQAKCNISMIVFSEKRIQGNVVEHVIHPAHVPFKIEPQASHVDWLRHHRPCRRFLRDHKRAGMLLKNRLVQLLKKVDGSRFSFPPY